MLKELTPNLSVRLEKILKFYKKVCNKPLFPIADGRLAFMRNEMDFSKSIS